MNKKFKTTSKEEYLSPIISVEELVKQDVLTVSPGGDNIGLNGDDTGSLDNYSLFKSMLGL